MSCLCRNHWRIICWSGRKSRLIRDRAVLLFARSSLFGIISKFVLYLGAGLSVRSTFFKIGEDYERRREEGIKERYVYEEILFVCRELTSGVPETEAYARFGQRCRYRQYTKLSALLAQNLRKGNQRALVSHAAGGAGIVRRET